MIALLCLCLAVVGRYVLGEPTRAKTGEETGTICDSTRKKGATGERCDGPDNRIGTEGVNSKVRPCRKICTYYFRHAASHMYRPKPIRAGTAYVLPARVIGQIRTRSPTPAPAKTGNSPCHPLRPEPRREGTRNRTRKNGRCSPICPRPWSPLQRKQPHRKREAAPETRSTGRYRPNGPRGVNEKPEEGLWEAGERDDDEDGVCRSCERPHPHAHRNFDSTKGYPGEGPSKGRAKTAYETEGTEMSRNKTQRTSDSTAISEFGSGDKVSSATTNPVRKSTATKCMNTKTAVSDSAAMTETSRPGSGQMTKNQPSSFCLKVPQQLRRSLVLQLAALVSAETKYPWRYSR